MKKDKNVQSYLTKEQMAVNIKHIIFAMQSCMEMAEYLFSNGQDELGYRVLISAAVNTNDSFDETKDMISIYWNDDSQNSESFDTGIELVSKCEKIQFPLTDKQKEQLLLTAKHKIFVMLSCMKMANHLFDDDQDEMACQLMLRAVKHDNSKYEKEELESLSKIDHSGMKDANEVLSQEKKNAIELHWKHNAHHPEHFDTAINMSTLDRIEMTCDWYSRSMEYGTDLLEFVYARQENRFHFPTEFFEEVVGYCNILLS